MGGGNGGRFAVHGGEGVEKQVADIGQDSGTARGDLVVGEEFIQLAEGMVDAGGGLESLDLPVRAEASSARSRSLRC